MKPDLIHQVLNGFMAFVALYLIGHIALALQPIVAQWMSSL